MIVWLPTASVVVAKVAWLVLFSAPVPSVVAPSLKVTEPVGTPGRRNHTLLRYPCHHAPSLSELVHPPHHLWMSMCSDWAATSPFSGRNLEASSPVPTDQNWQWYDNTTIS